MNEPKPLSWDWGSICDSGWACASFGVDLNCVLRITIVYGPKKLRFNVKNSGRFNATLRMSDAFSGWL